MEDDSLGKRASTRLIAQALRGEKWTLNWEGKDMEEAVELTAELGLDDDTLSKDERAARKLEVEVRLAREACIPYELWKALYPDS